MFDLSSQIELFTKLIVSADVSIDVPIVKPDKWFMHSEYALCFKNCGGCNNQLYNVKKYMAGR